MAEELKDVLKKVLASQGARRFFFAYGLGNRKDGNGEGELAVHGKKFKKAEVELPLADCKDVYEGVCWLGKGEQDSATIYFQGKGKKLSTALIAKMIKTAKHVAGRQFDFQLPSPAEEARAETLSEAEGDESGAPTSSGTVPPAPPVPPPPVPPPPAPPPPAPQPAGNAAALQFAAKLKALAPIMQKAEATGSELAKAARDTLAQANKLFVGKQYEEALAGLDKAEALLKQVFATKANPFAELYHGLLSTLPSDIERLRSINPTAAVAVQKVVDAAKGHAQNGDFERAYHFLDQATQAIAKAKQTARVQEAVDVIPEGKVKDMIDQLAGVHNQWQAALNQARSHIGPLQAQMQDTFPATALHLENIINSYWEEFFDVLADAEGRRDPDELEAAVGAVREKMRALWTEMEDDKLFDYLDGNGVAVRAAFTDAFADVDSLLPTFK